MKHEFTIAMEIIRDAIKDSGSFRPIKLLFGKRVYSTCNMRFYGSLLDYVRFCRLNNFVITITGEEF